jgi:hypothetical protein
MRVEDAAPATIIAGLVDNPKAVVSLDEVRALPKPWGALAWALQRTASEQRLRTARIRLAGWFEATAEDLRPELEAAFKNVRGTDWAAPKPRRPVRSRCAGCGQPLLVYRRRPEGNYCRPPRWCKKRAQRARARARAEAET